MRSRQVRQGFRTLLIRQYCDTVRVGGRAGVRRTETEKDEGGGKSGEFGRGGNERRRRGLRSVALKAFQVQVCRRQHLLRYAICIPLSAGSSIQRMDTP
jgi:hypothetical protein